MTTPQTSSQRGFTVIELIVVAMVLILTAVLVFFQINSIRVADQNTMRKTAINAMYFSLEEVYYKQHSSYPAKINSATLASVDPALFTDPDGFVLGKEALSEEELQKIIESGDADDDVTKRLASISAGKSPNYHYEGTNCDTEGKCKSYTLRADLEGEAQYVKKSRKS